jgi:branched-chain amino acid aminotransferase
MPKHVHEFLPTAYFEKKFIDFKDANLSIATHALHYGTAAFGGLRGILNPENNKEAFLFRLDNHTKRLENSAKMLNYELKAENIKNLIIEFVEKNKPISDFYIRPLIYLSDLGIAPRLHDIEKDFLIYGLLMGDYLKPEGIKVTFSSWFRPSDSAIPTRGKLSGAYINSAMAKTEAINRGFDEALMMDNRGFITEASAMNLFMIRDGKLITPPTQSDILEGITRLSVIELAKDLGIEVIEREISKTETMICDEFFLTGTAARITPVYQVENYKMPEQNPITQRLQKALKSISLGLDLNYEKWITRIKI